MKVVMIMNVNHKARESALRKSTAMSDVDLKFVLLDGRKNLLAGRWTMKRGSMDGWNFLAKECKVSSLPNPDE